MRSGSSLEDLNATIVKVGRHTVANAAPNQPKAWTVVTFETSLDADKLAAEFSEILDDRPAVWYTHFRAEEEMFVIFPHRIFRYRVGDKMGKTHAQDYARSIGVPGRQVDWDEA